MIVPMKKVTLLALGTEQDEALTALRGLGVMQVETIRSSASENAQQLAEELSEATRITGELEKLVQENGGEIPPGKPRSGAEALEEAADLLDKRERFAGELENIRQRQKALSVWGEFNRDTLTALEAKGIHVHLCCGNEKQYEAAEALEFNAVAGKSYSESLDLLGVEATMAAAGNMDLEVAADQLLSALAATNTATDDASTYVDMLAMASARSKSDMEGLGEAVIRLGTTMTFLEGGTAEMLTIFGELGNRGAQNAEMGTYARNVLLSLIAPRRGDRQTAQSVRDTDRSGYSPIDIDEKRAQQDAGDDIQSANAGICHRPYGSGYIGQLENVNAADHRLGGICRAGSCSARKRSGRSVAYNSVADRSS